MTQIARTVTKSAQVAAEPALAPRGWSAKLFKLFWILALFFLLMNFGRFFGFGNLNALEKSLFLVSGLFLLIASPVNKVSIAGCCLVLTSVLIFGAATSFSAFSWGRVGMAIAALFSLLIFFIVSPSNRDRMLILRSIALATPIIILLSLLLTFLFGAPLYMVDHTGASRLGGIAGPAFLAAAAYSSAVASAQMFAVTRLKRYFVLVFACVFVSFLSGTRMPSLVAAASAFSVLFFAMRGSVLRGAFIVLGLTAVIAFLFSFGDQLLMRLETSTASGRNLLWNAALQWVDKYPWHGVGFGHHSLILPAEVSAKTRTIAIHNEYIRLAAELGYIGAGLAFAGLFLTFFGAMTRKEFADTFLAVWIIGLFFLYGYSDNIFSVTYCLFGPLAFAIGSGLKTKLT